jgi:hypothetical protein
MTLSRLLCALPILVLVGCASKQSAPPPQAAAAEPAKAPTPVPVITVPQGTLLHVRLAETLDTKRNRSGDRFSATLASPVAVDGQTVIPKGARFSGRIDTSAPSGRLKGRAVMNLSLDTFELNGKKYDIKTSHASRTSGSHKKRNLLAIGGGAVGGAAVGALAGGPAGALIGAGAGAGAGTAGAAFTGKKNVRIPVETPISFQLRAPVPL